MDSDADIERAVDRVRVKTETREQARQTAKDAYEAVKKAGAVLCSEWLMARGKEFVTTDEPETAKSIGQEAVRELRQRLEEESERAQFRFMEALNSADGLRWFEGDPPGLSHTRGRTSERGPVLNPIRKVIDATVGVLGALLADAGFRNTNTFQAWFWGYQNGKWAPELSRLDHGKSVPWSEGFERAVRQYASAVAVLAGATEELREATQQRDRAQATQLWDD